jgi:hypothetical protein
MRRRLFATALLALFVTGCGDRKITEPRGPAKVSVLAAIGTDPGTGATIETDLDDYLPGGAITVRGRGWAPNETVRLSMTESPDTHPDVSTDVQVDSTGAFVLPFYEVQQSDLGVTFTLTATGLASGSVAVATFTDGRAISTLTLNGLSTVTVAPSASISANAQGTLNGNSNNTLGSIGLKAYPDGSPVSSAVVVVCFNVNPDLGPTVPPNSISFSQTFPFNAPAAGGIYDVDVTSYSDNACAVTAGATTLTVDKAITVQSNTAPTLAPIGNKAVNEGSALTFTASATDTDTPAQTLTYSLVGAPATATINGSSGAFSWTPTDGPAQTATFKVRVTDNGTPTLSDEEEITVTVNNVAPTATFNAPTTVSAGANINLSMTGPGDASTVDAAAGFTYAFDCGAGGGYGAFSGTSTATCPTSAPGSRTVKGKIRDKDGGEAEHTASVAIDNVPPTASAAGPYAGNEGSSINIAGTGADPDGGTVTFLWSVAPNDGHCVIASPTTASTTVTCNDNGAWTLTLKVTDDETSFTTSDATLTVANVVPTIVGLTAPAAVNEGQNIVFSVASITDPSTVDAAAGFTYAFSCDGTTPSIYGATNSKTCPTTDNGTVTIKAVVKDKDGGESLESSKDVTVNNVAPTATFNAPSAVNEGSPISLSLTSPIDPSSADVAAGFTYAFDCGSGYGAFGGSNTASCATTDNETRSVKGKIRDKDAGVTEYSASVTINNVAPTVSIGGGVTINEGDTFSRSGSFTDPGVDAWTATVNYGDASGVQALTLSGKTFSLSHTYTDNGNYNVTVTVTDDDTGVGSDVVVVSVNNVAPQITTPIVVPIAPIATGTPITVSWTFTDPGVDTWSCKISWDQPILFGSLFASSGKTCSATTSSLPAGIYTVTVYVQDDDGGSDQQTATAYIVVYDPSAGFVTGGGWIDSPAGAYVANPSLTGKANFGFVAKYKKGQSAPDGNTEFQFHEGNLNFKSASYEWLVVAGARAQFKGKGTINGAGNFGFMLTAIDGQTSGGGGVDKFRMKIWVINSDGSEGQVVYDNQMGAGVDDALTTTLGGGSIQIQSSK